MNSRNRHVRLGLLACAVVWAGAVWAQTERVKLTLNGAWPGYPIGPAQAVVVNGQYAYCAIAEVRLLILDVSNPSNPKTSGGIDTIGSADDVAVSGNHACVADESGGLQVIDLTNPDWVEMLRSENTNCVTLPLWSGNEFFRLMKP